MKKQYKLIGGPNHGDRIFVPGNQNELESPVFPDEAKAKDSSHSETYTRRRFEGEEFGKGYECFGLADDDDTDTKELTRMVLNEEGASKSKSS